MSIRWSKTPNDVLVRNMPNLKPGSVLDLGGSDGVNAIYLAKGKFDVTNVDKDAQALDDLKLIASQEKLEIITEHCDLSKYEFNSDYDNVITLYTLHFLQQEFANKLLLNMKKHTRTGGLNIIVGFTAVGEFDVDSNKCYLKDGYLQSLYTDWQILEHSKFSGPTKSGKIQEREVLVARKTN